MSSDQDADGFREFHRDEYLTLRTEIDRHDAQRARLQYLSILASVLISWWLIRTESDRYPALLLLVLSGLPIIMLAAGWWISQAHVGRSYDIGKYLKRLEQKFGNPELGWEQFLGELRASGQTTSVTKRTKALFVAVGVVETLVLVANYLHKHPEVPGLLP